MANMRLPVYMRVGGGGEHEVGEILLPVDGDGTATLTTTDIADALPAAADAVEKLPEQEVTDAPA